MGPIRHSTLTLGSRIPLFEGPKSLVVDDDATAEFTSSKSQKPIKLEAYGVRSYVRRYPTPSGPISSTVSSARARRNLAKLPIIRPLRFNIAPETRSPDVRQGTIPGARVIRPPGPTVSIRPASLLYRAPTALHGAASHLLRHLLRASTPTASPTPKPPPGSPVKFISLPSEGDRGAHGPDLYQNDSILDGFLLNNGGYLDDSDSESESETEDPSYCESTDPTVTDLVKQPTALSFNVTTKPVPDSPPSRSPFKPSIVYF
ncbi:hypothetical protein PSTT_10864 [Puccinia striiformis]|uniref:Uncharacterized protein n=1 Tax=Puccinia striiformis TaxID=27350 RepID=A0A2S4V2P5_9BASI|nr:hypothetical protein PSTT_10864 [Puccinia striiformis]